MQFALNCNPYLRFQQQYKYIQGLLQAAIVQKLNCRRQNYLNGGKNDNKTFGRWWGYIATVHTSAKDVQTDFHVTCVWVYAISQ